jgi:uncharacterized membrane protein YkvA (DUF1232 family)
MTGPSWGTMVAEVSVPMRRRTALMGITRALRDSARPGAPGVGDRFAALPRLFRRTMRGEYRGLTRGRLAMFGLGALYIVSPVDLAPEALLTVFGLADDAVVGVWLMGNLLDEAERFLAWEQVKPRVVPGEVIDDPR